MTKEFIEIRGEDFVSRKDLEQLLKNVGITSFYHEKFGEDEYDKRTVSCYHKRDIVLTTTARNEQREYTFAGEGETIRYTVQYLTDSGVNLQEAKE